MPKAYEETIKEIAGYIRDELKHIEELHSLDFEITVDGRVHDGHLNIKFALGYSHGVGGKVEGGVLEEVLIEYMRRFGWDKRNKPLELSFDGKTEGDF